MSRVTESLIQIQNRTKEYERTILTETSHQSNDVETIKYYCKSLEKIQTHLNKDISVQGEKAFTGFESLRLATESTDKTTLLVESIKTVKIIRKIIFF